MTRARKRQITGWALSFLVFAMLVGGCLFMTVIDSEQKSLLETMLAMIGVTPNETLQFMVVGALLGGMFVIPRLSFLIAIMLTGYLGAAAAICFLVQFPPHVPIALCVVAWIALGYRDPAVVWLATGEPMARQTQSDATQANDQLERTT
jgi:hypothetical protein